jgi:HD-like signal output (HDOD) protein
MIDQEIRNFIARMPGFSVTVGKVVEVCNHPASSAQDLNKVISLDPVLTGKVLKLVNSAYYSLGREVASVTHAIILLGINTVKNLALSTAILGGIGGKNSFRCLSMDDFWVHSLGTGVIARSFARLTDIPMTEQEEYFVAGLLHDLGKIPLNTCDPERYNQALETANRERIPLCEAEKKCLALDHCTVGGWIAEKWRLHRNLSHVFHNHHRMESGLQEKRPLTAVASLANLYANQWKIGSAGDAAPSRELLDHYEQKLNLAPERIAAIYDRVLEDIENAKIFLQVAREE